MISLNRPLSFCHYQEWLELGFQGEMDYMAKNQEVRELPGEHFAPMQSLIVFTRSYFPHPEPAENLFPSLKIAHYARNKDYHVWFRNQLNDLVSQLKQEFPEEQFLSFTDAVPLLERDYGAQAALGWIGKNTCLIHPERGSLFFIGEILTTLPCGNQQPPIHDFCGKCTACIDACPTQALNEKRQLDSNLCLAHWNIESRDVPPPEIREKMEGWFFGCDICQTVCPWNLKIHKNVPGFNGATGESEELEEELRWILTHSHKQILKKISETPLSRAGGRGLKRNALIVVGNLKIKSLQKEVESYLDHDRLGSLAQWTLMKLTSS